jgi:hypothetical protein
MPLGFLRSSHFNVRKENTMKPWLKAGLIGGVVLALTSLASLVPQLGVVCCCL